VALDRERLVAQMMATTVAFSHAINQYGEEINELINQPNNGYLTELQYKVNKLIVPNVSIVVTHGIDRCNEILDKLKNVEDEEYTNQQWYKDMLNIYLEQCGGALRL
jgi:hypothetical protein